MTPPLPAIEGRPLALVVDDEPAVRRMTGLMLQSLGYAAVFAADGTEAVRLYAEHRDQLRVVLLDLTMPGLDGLHVLAAIRESGGRTPVVVMSGYAEQDVSDKLPALDFQSFVAKPFTREHLARSLAGVNPGGE